MRINLDQKEIQQKMQEKFGDIKGCEILMDDMLIYDENTEGHNKRLETLSWEQSMKQVWSITPRSAT